MIKFNNKKIRQIEFSVFFFSGWLNYICIVIKRLCPNKGRKPKEQMKGPIKLLTGLRRLSLLACLNLFLVYSGAKASHLVGGEINYKYISQNNYLITLKLYRDCAGIPMVGSTSVNIISVNCGFSTTALLSLTGGPTQISPVCSSQILNTTCNSGYYMGIEEYIYTGTAAINYPCSDWIISWNECCRNTGISNLVITNGIQQAGLYLSATLNNYNFPSNNSCQFMYPPLTVIKMDTTTINWSAIDVDGDSLSYRLTPARDFDTLNAVSIPYISPATYLNPLFASDPAKLDSTTGVLTVSPNVLQLAVVSMAVSEYRNGIKIGEVSRDCQILVDQTTNNLPTLTGINGTNTFIHTACPGDTINFSIFSYDSDSLQTLTTSWDSSFFGPVVTSNYAQYPITNVYWVVDSSYISSQPYLLTIKVSDDNCPYTGIQYYTYKIYVRPCNSILVWPGDADMNTVANVFDFLPIGIANGVTGPARSNISNAWIGESCMDWPQNFVSGVNYKHADCNGDSIIDLNDTLAIIQNYGFVHNLKVTTVSSTTSFGQPNIYLLSNVDTTGINTVIYYDVVVGDSLVPMDSIYGLAFSLQFSNPNVIGGISITYLNSFMGTPGVDLFKMEKVMPSSGLVDIGMTKINHSNQTGYGTVARIGVVITDNISGRVKFFPVITGCEGVTANESYLDMGRICDTIIIDPLFTGIHTIDLHNEVTVYPNPSDSKVTIATGLSKIERIQVADELGRIIQDTNFTRQNKIVLNVSGLNNGIYYARIITDKGTAIKKIIVARPIKK